MKVLMLSWEYKPNIVGGLGKHVMDLVPRLVEDGVEVHLVTPRLAGGDYQEPVEMCDGTLATNGSTVYRVDASGISQTQFFANTWHDNLLVQEFCNKLIREHGDFDLIHNHDWLSGFAAITLKREHRLPLITTIHATEMGRHGGSLYSDMQRSIHQAEWWLTYEAWRIIAASRYMKWEISHYFDVPDDKIDVIANGVDAERFDKFKGVDLSDFRLQYAKPDEPIIYYVGRMVPEKGLWALVDSIPLVLRDYPGARFIIAGGGDYANDLKAQAWRLRVHENVLFPGRISDDERDKLFKVANCAVFPSLYEPFGIVALEAMAAGCPVVVSDVGGLSEVVEHNETGLTVYPNDAGSLAWGILETLRHPDRAQTRVQNALPVAREQYNWHLIARRTMSVYSRVVDEAKAGDWAYTEA